jgi:hypothetical protein
LEESEEVNVHADVDAGGDEGREASIELEDDVDDDQETVLAATSNNALFCMYQRDSNEKILSLRKESK